MGARQKYDWNALGAEWVSSKMSLAEFRRKRIPKADAKHFYHKVEEYGWMAEKVRVEKTAWERASKKAIDKRTADFGKMILANEAILRHVYGVLKGRENKDGTIRPLDPDEIKKMADSIGSLAKNKSFMEGGPTERLEHKSANLHGDILELIEWMKAQDDPGK